MHCRRIFSGLFHYNKPQIITGILRKGIILPDCLLEIVDGIFVLAGLIIHKAKQVIIFPAEGFPVGLFKIPR